MTFVTTYQGEVQLLKYMLNFSAADNVVLHLYKNNQTPTQSDTLANYTESAAAGYSSMTLTGSQWTISTIAGTSSAQYANQVFTFSTSESLYGYYITNNASTTLIWAERFPSAPFNVATTGGNVNIDPLLTLL